ncbi:MAG: hypothetical protein LAO03_11800 [Acidobacteriia bacterium]|nr:hypothetical protein [Terriglobia bacterium]
MQAYTPMATLSNNFKYVGQVKAFLSGGKVNVYDVCTYGYDHVPVGPDLQVKLTVTQPLAFSPVAAPKIAILGPIKIINGQCNMLPSVTPSTVADLTAHWGSCQNMAYDVNFAMQPSARLLGSSSPGAQSGSPGAQPGMLSSTPQQGMLAADAPPSAQTQAAPGGLMGNRQTMPGQGGGSQSAGSKVELNPQPLPPGQRLTNADVIKMLKGGIPESVIVSSVHSSHRTFDFSPSGCRALQQAHVSEKVLNAMGDGSVRPCAAGPSSRGGTTSTNVEDCEKACVANCLSSTDPAQATKCGKTCHNQCSQTPSRQLTETAPSPENIAADDLNPQPLPPAVKKSGLRDGEPGADSRALQSAKAIRVGRKLRNPNVSATGLPLAVYAALEQQKRLYVPRQPVTSSGPATVESLSTKPAPTVALNSSLPAVSAKQNSVINVNPVSNGASASKYGALPAGLHTKVCMQGPPGVGWVNNTTGGASFSPDPQYNAYVIQGCNFGSTAGTVHLFGAFNDSSQMFFTVDPGGWSEGALYLHLNPNITGELDNNNVTLVIQRADGVTSHISGFKFVAVRDTQNPLFLNQVPQSIIALGEGLSLNNGITYFSPYPAKSASVDIARGAPKLFATGYDTYDFTKMLPGFVLWDVQHQYSDQIAQYQQSPPPHWSKWDYGRWGSWNVQFDSKGIRVDYEVDYLNWQIFAGTQGWDDYMSEYSLGIWVVGPRGVNDPWPSNLH